MYTIYTQPCGVYIHNIYIYVYCVNVHGCVYIHNRVGTIRQGVPTSTARWRFSEVEPRELLTLF